MALKPPSNVFRTADVRFPAALSVRGARFFIGSRKRTRGLFTVSAGGAARPASQQQCSHGGRHRRPSALTLRPDRSVRATREQGVLGYVGPHA